MAQIEGAQEEINQALLDINKHRRIMDGGNEAPMYPPYDDAVRRFRAVLIDLPSGISCVSVQAEFPYVTQETRDNFPGWTGKSLQVLQHQLTQIEPAVATQNPVSFEFVVKPNKYPEELRGLTFGSRARDLAADVFETVEVRFDWGHHFLQIRPDGIRESYGTYAKPFNVPLQVVRGIGLHADRKPLTPSLEGTDPLRLRPTPTAY